ncbi:unnamed protein product [Penicillium bialowiezense]
MKLGLAITSLFAASAAAAAKYAAGQDCRTNKGCDDNCIGSKWSIVMVAGDARMVCDPSNRDSIRYAAGSCTAKGSNTDSTSPEGIKITKATCEEDLTAQFLQECASQGIKQRSQFSFEAELLVYPSKEDAVKFTDCQTSIYS